MSTILVVDDNPLNRDLAKAMLSSTAKSVLLASSGEEALAVLTTTPVDVVVTDIGMPGMSGIELCETVRASMGADRPRLVAFTSFGMANEREKMMAAGFDGIVTKPASRATLKAAIELTLITLRARV